jgi:hypothetical protein
MLANMIAALGARARAASLAACTVCAALGLLGCGSASDPYEAAAEACVDDINTLRATLKLPPYDRWTDGEACAGGEAQTDSLTGTPHSAFGGCGETAQDECPGWPGPAGTMIGECLTMMWAEGPGTDFATHGHYINMSSTSYSKVACGFYTLADGKTIWATQDFQ